MLLPLCFHDKMINFANASSRSVYYHTIQQEMITYVIREMRYANAYVTYMKDGIGFRMVLSENISSGPFNQPWLL